MVFHGAQEARGVPSAESGELQVTVRLRRDMEDKATAKGRHSGSPAEDHGAGT